MLLLTKSQLITHKLITHKAIGIQPYHSSARFVCAMCLLLSAYVYVKKRRKYRSEGRYYQYFINIIFSYCGVMCMFILAIGCYCFYRNSILEKRKKMSSF